jgi:nuclear transport factor 2 (NTF2) superfamily protein
VGFAYEWHDDSGSWYRRYGNENWEFDESGLMRVRIASINDVPSRKPIASTTDLLAAVPTFTGR